MHVDVLMFGAHPDDIECGIGGTALLLTEAGLSFGIFDLTKGEMGSRGTVEERAAEARDAAHVLGAAFRENLDLGDCKLTDTIESRMAVAKLIRKHTPRIVLAPFWEDLHNDHVAAGLIVRHSSTYCSVAKLSDAAPPYRPPLFLYYLLHNFHTPSVILDITSVFEQKLTALKCYRSQFEKNASDYGVVPIGIGDYLFHLESRCRYFGSLANTKYGEPFVADRPLVLKQLQQIL